MEVFHETQVRRADGNPENDPCSCFVSASLHIYTS